MMHSDSCACSKEREREREQHTIRQSDGKRSGCIKGAELLRKLPLGAASSFADRSCCLQSDWQSCFWSLPWSNNDGVVFPFPERARDCSKAHSSAGKFVSVVWSTKTAVMIIRLGRLTPGYFRLLQRQVAGEVQAPAHDRSVNQIAMMLAIMGLSMSYYSAKQMTEKVHHEPTP
ncbi:uncharacterized protein LOC120491114 [Pimephales promelas]|uniref:uncharacterized protein LOC120491114 n=1 Tax=Pimephales promelas TaxID=90988 RepID=UPI0019555F94|nr:uncharacterized protein LOC120491114 [Pimephales promelas]